MRERLAILGGTPAITLDHTYYAQWPIYTEEEVETVSALIRNSGLSSAHYDPAGPIAQLEQAIAERWGVRYVLTHHSGTAALNAALFGVGVVPGDEVIVQSATHPFSCIPIVGCGAIPVFADVDPHTRLLDPADVERRITPRTKAILVVHWSGMPADMDTLLDVARRHDLRIVEDNCVSQSTLHRGRMCGTLADAGAISLQHGKLTSAGEGGVFFTDDPQVYQRAASRGHYERLQGLPDAQYRTVSGFAFGEKYRIATITAAIGAVQMRHWDEHMARRKRNAEQLGQAIEEVGGFSFRPVPDYVESPYHQGWVRFTPEELGGIDRETLIAALQAEGAQVSNPATGATSIPHTELVRALHLHPVFAGNAAGADDLLWEALGVTVQERPRYGPGTLPVTEDLDVPHNTLQLPTFARPADELIGQYATAFRKIAAQADALVGR